LDPILQAAARHVLSKDDHLIANGAEKPAWGEVGVFREVNPRLEFAQEIATIRLFDAGGTLDGKA
jgi:hypothetical protein